MTLRVEYQVSPQELPTSVVSDSRKSRKHRSWFARWTAPLVLFLIGCLALGYYAYDILDARLFQDEQSRQFDQALRNAHDDSARSSAPDKTPAEELRAEALADLKSREKPASTSPKMPAFSEPAAGKEPKQPETTAANTPLG